MPDPSDYENMACAEEGLDLGYISAQTHQSNIQLQSSLQILLNGDLSLLSYYLQLEAIFSERGQLAVRVGGVEAQVTLCKKCCRASFLCVNQFSFVTEVTLTR